MIEHSASIQPRTSPPKFGTRALLVAITLTTQWLDSFFGAQVQLAYLFEDFPARARAATGEANPAFQAIAAALFYGPRGAGKDITCPPVLFNTGFLSFRVSGFLGFLIFLNFRDSRGTKV